MQSQQGLVRKMLVDSMSHSHVRQKHIFFDEPIAVLELVDTASAWETRLFVEHER